MHGKHALTEEPDSVTEAPIPAMDRHVLERTAAHLHERYEHVTDRATVDRTLEQSYREMERRARVKTHLPLLAGNFADSQLRSLGIARGIIESPLPRVLFIDDVNAGRSQMAASLLLKHSGGRITARSAGLLPAGHLHEDALTVMAEIGVPLDDSYPKPLSPDVHRAAQYVVTFACADRVQALPGQDVRDWDIPSFVDRSLEDIRAMRDDLRGRVLALMRELGVEDDGQATAMASADSPGLRMPA